MPKMKSKKSCTKRIKINKNGIASHGVSFKRHGMYWRGKKRVKNHGTQKISGPMMSVLSRVYPYSSARRLKNKRIKQSEIIIENK